MKKKKIKNMSGYYYAYGDIPAREEIVGMKL